MNDLLPVVSLPAEYAAMVENINATLPAIKIASEAFNKSGSQFKYTLVDMTRVTPLATAKNILAECNRTRQALEEAYIKLRRNELRLTRLTNDDPETELDRLELQMQNANLQDAMSGAVRKLSYMVAQYKHLVDAMGENVSEAAYEAQEERYHIMTAFKQALSAARSHGGWIDEGNQIYLFDIGINGAHAQFEVDTYLKMEAELFAEGKAPTHEMTLRWLEHCADTFAGCGAKFAERRGLLLLDESSLAT